MRSHKRLVQWVLAIALALIATCAVVAALDPQRTAAIELYESVLPTMRQEDVVGLISNRGLTIEPDGDSPSIRCPVDDRFVVVVVFDENGMVYSKRLCEDGIPKPTMANSIRSALKWFGLASSSVDRSWPMSPELGSNHVE